MPETPAMRTHRLAHRGYVRNAKREQPDHPLDDPDANQLLKQVDPVAFNQSAEIRALSFLTDYIQNKGAPRFNTACNLIALELDVSVETAKRYLRKYSVDHPKARFEIIDGYVRLRRGK